MTTASLVGSVVEMAWLAAGSPAPNAEPVAPASGGWCARCGTRDRPTTHFRAAVSTKFTDFDSWMYSGDRLCVACAWAYRTVELRRQVWIVTAGAAPRLTISDRTHLRELLRAPLRATQAVIVPTRGRKHVLPSAGWGYVCADEYSMRWDHTAAQLHTTLCALRRYPGVTATALTAPVPPITTLRAAGPDDVAGLLRQWQTVAPWRGHPWWDTAIAVSSPPTRP